MTTTSTNTVQDLQAGDEPQLEEMDSLCMRCMETGSTRILISRIAFFREIMVSSFECPHCGYANRSIDPAAAVQDFGQRISVKVLSTQDLNRRIVRPSHSSVKIHELDATFPCSEGDLTTIEGVIQATISNIQELQPDRKIHQPAVAAQLDEFTEKLKALLKVESPFTLILDDPTGNGVIENFLAPKPDPELSRQQYTRTKEQNHMLGLYSPDELDEKVEDGGLKTIKEDEDFETEKIIGTGEVLDFQSNCPNCQMKTSTHMKLVDIPHFKQVIVMSSVCDKCGHRETEVKSGSGIEPKGRRQTLTIARQEDLCRDVIFSETAQISIPSVQLQSDSGSLGGRFTTVEGLLRALRDQLVTANPFGVGDSAISTKYKHLIDQLEEIASGRVDNPVIEISDPAGNSYLQDAFYPDPDPYLKVEDYTRSHDDDDTLGLLDMKTENYE